MNIENKPNKNYYLIMVFNKKLYFVFVLSVISFAAFSVSFSSKVTASELQTLAEGKVLARNIDKFKNISIESGNPVVEKMKNQIKDLDPNYLAELIQFRPVEGNEDLPERLFKVLSDIPHYAGIPYWSVRHERYYDLYSTAEILDKNEINENMVCYNTDLVMEPFGHIFTPITIEKGTDYLFYTNSNSNDLKLKGITAVKKKNMKSIIILFKDGDYWILYGIGGCKAPKIAMFEERIQTSFINRIKTFCNFAFTQL